MRPLLFVDIVIVVVVIIFVFVIAVTIICTQGERLVCLRFYFQPSSSTPFVVDQTCIMYDIRQYTVANAALCASIRYDYSNSTGRFLQRQLVLGLFGTRNIQLGSCAFYFESANTQPIRSDECVVDITHYYTIRYSILF